MDEKGGNFEKITNGFRRLTRASLLQKVTIILSNPTYLPYSLMIMDSEDPFSCLVFTTPDSSEILQVLAALSAVELEYRLEFEADQWQVFTTSADVESALAEIHLLRDNTIPVQEAPENLLVFRGFSGIILLFTMLCVHVLAGSEGNHISLLKEASANSEAIRRGEWWRTITSLFLHGDVSHLFSNLVSLSAFGYLVCRRYGSGVGTFALLGSGLIGNWLVAHVTSSTFSSIGASTSGFGAVGILSGYELIRRFVARVGDSALDHRSLWVPVMAGLGLLALFGTAPGSNILAHAFGFVSGVLLGVLFRSNERVLSSPEWQFVFGFLAIFLAGISWGLLIYFHSY